MALKSGLEKFKADNQKLKNQSSSQAVSPMTERIVNNNTNPDSLKMAGTEAAKQGAMNQAAKDQAAVQNGALAQQQQAAQQQRGLQDQGKSVAEFQSEGVEKAQEQVNEKANQWAENMAAFGSLGARVSTAVQEELAAGGEVAAQFEVNEEMMTEATKTLAAPGQEQAARGIMDNVIQSLQDGNPADAIRSLTDNYQLFNVDTTNSSAALTQIFGALDIDPSQQQAMVADALTEGVIQPEQMNMQFLMDQGILTTDNAMIPELGLEVSEIEEMVGPNWRDMTVEQIEKELELTMDDESERDDIMRELANPNIDPTRKAELQRELQLLGASGVTSAEEMAQRGIDRAAQANQVIMGDELKSVEEVLDDDALRAASNDLMMQIQEDPENAAAILEQWKKDNPGYESMGDWVKDSIETLGDKEGMIEDAQELVEKKNKESAEFVNDNELFGATEGAKDVLEALGFNTEGFGAMGNDPSQNPTYQALASYKETNPDQFEMFQQNLVNMDPEDLEGLQGADITTIMKTLGTKEGMKEFNYLRELNNEMALMNADSYTSVMDAILPKGINNEFTEMLGDKDRAQEYLSDLRKLKDLGVLSPELETFSRLMDQGPLDKNGNPTPGDGIIDSPAEIAERIKGMVGDGINISNFQDGDAQQLMELMKQGTVGIQGIVDKKLAEYDKNELQPWQESVKTASRATQDIAAKNTWMKDGVADVGAAYSSHPSRGRWKKAFDVGKLGPGTAQKAGAMVFSAMAKDPTIFDKMPPFNGGIPSKDVINWFAKNIGLPTSYAKTGDTAKAQVQLILNNIVREGGGKWTSFNGTASGGDFKKGLENLFGKDIKNATAAQAEYKKNSDIANSTQPKNDWADF